MSITSKSYFSSLNILFYAMAGGQAIFLMVAFYLRSQGEMGPEDEDLGQLFLIVAAVLLASTQLASRFLIGKRLEAIRKLGLKSKMNQYRGVFILRLALLEGPALFCIVAYLVTGNFWLMLCAIGMLILFLTYYPSYNKVVNELELNANERHQVNNPEAVIADTNIEN
ncbi:MAG: hypothetical protein AAF927_07800 [Bacteroidota bacterium]